MNILLTGKNGQVGFELQRALAPLGNVTAVDYQECDLADAVALRALLSTVKPDVIVNPAAYTAVDKAETEREQAFAINAQAPGILGEYAAAHGGLVVHYSTDYVFDGGKQGAYAETDLPAPQSVYGQSKLAGEQALQSSGAKHLILRTSWVVGAHGNNFAKTMLRLAGERDSLRVVADQFGAPTSASLLADVTAQVLGRYTHASATEDFQYGLYHLAASGVTNWCDYARYVIAAAQSAGKSLKAAPESVLPITTAEYPLPAPRPINSRLDTHKLQSAFGLTLPQWQQGLDHILQQIL